MYILVHTRKALTYCKYVCVCMYIVQCTRTLYNEILYSVHTVYVLVRLITYIMYLCMTYVLVPVNILLSTSDTRVAQY